jgi:HEAT repeat protein
VDPWVGFAIIGDVARDNTDILHKLAFLYTELHCHDAIRGLAHAERIDEPIWRALSSAASGGDGWAIEAIGKSRDKRALDVLEQAANQYLSDGPAAKLAEALGRCSGERAGAILTQLLEKNDRRGGDDFVKAAADAAADIGYKLAIPLLSKQLSELEKKYGKYPNSIVAKEPEFGFRSSWEPGNSSVGSLTLALGRLAYPEVKETIKRILRKPVDRIEQKEDIFSTDYLLRSTRYPYNAPSTSVWTITYNAWTLYQATRAAASYADPEFVELLVRYLKHENTVVRYGAVTALATYAPGKYRAGFAGCLGDKDALVREAAVRAQGKILARSSDPGAIGAVVELLGDEDDGVRGGAYAAVLAIGPGAVPVLKSQAARPNLRTRVGVLTALAELADVREIPAQAAKQDGLATIFVTPEMVRNGDFMAATQALREASAACATKGEIAQRVHLEFPAPRTGDERDALRQWILRLDAEFPQTPCLLSDQALSAWLRLRLPKRVQDIREGQATGEYGGSASRAALLMELSDRAREFAAQIARGDRRVQERVEKAVVERLVANLQ